MMLLWLSLLLFVKSGILSKMQSSDANSRNPQEIAFCELVRHPENYDGKTVLFTATYGGSIEGSIFFDEHCKRTNPEDDVVALATFTKASHEHGSPLGKKFEKLLKRTGSVRLTAVGLFVDGKERVFGHLNCCRYKLEVQKLLAVEKAD